MSRLVSFSHKRTTSRGILGEMQKRCGEKNRTKEWREDGRVKVCVCTSLCIFSVSNSDLQKNMVQVSGSLRNAGFVVIG